MPEVPPSSDGASDLADLKTWAKESLRQSMRRVRRALPQQARQLRSERVTASIRSLPDYRDARMLLLYWPMPDEVDLRPLAELAVAEGKSLALPRMRTDEVGLDLYAYAPGDALEAHPWGLSQPQAQSPRVESRDIDLVLVPALAVDEYGTRLGYGKGFYDRLLPTLDGAVTCAAIFHFQLVAELPREDFDWPVQWVASDEGAFATSPPA
mgnify:CR=1 FL=1